MNKLDLIINEIDGFLNSTDPVDYFPLTKALAAARELRDMKPVCYGYKGLNDEIMDCAVDKDVEYCIPLYALGESND